MNKPAPAQFARSFMFLALEGDQYLERVAQALEDLKQAGTRSMAGDLACEMAGAKVAEARDELEAMLAAMKASTE